MFYNSTVSSSINALVAVTVEDFILPLNKTLTDKQVTWMNMGLSKLCKKEYYYLFRTYITNVHTGDDDYYSNPRTNKMKTERPLK